MMFDGVIIYRLCDELICSPSVVVSEIYNYNVVVRITPISIMPSATDVLLTF